MELTDFLAGHPDAYAVFENVQSVLEGLGAVEVRASKSQVAFRRQGLCLSVAPGPVPGNAARRSGPVDRAGPSIDAVQEWCTPLRRSGCTTSRSRT